MYRTKSSCFLLIFCGALFVSHCQKVPFRLTTGVKGGTYDKIGESLKINLKLKIQLMESKGSVENLDRLSRNEADLGLSQLDVYHTLSSGGKADQLSIIFPLYYEELHLVVNESVKDFADLKKKKIAIGPGGSGTAFTAARVLDKAGMLKSVIVTTDQGHEAIAKFNSGAIDGFFMMTGSPSALLKDALKGQPTLLSLPEDLLRELTKEADYHEAEIPAGKYPWQKTTIKTIAADVVLAGRRELHADTVLYILDKISQKQTLLKREHEKWAQLNPAHARKLFETRKTAFHPAAAYHIQKASTGSH